MRSSRSLQSGDALKSDTCEILFMRNPNLPRVPASKLWGWPWLAALVLITLLSAASAALTPETSLRASLAALPLSFEPNLGQFDPEISFQVRGGGCAIALSPTRATFIWGERQWPQENSSGRRHLPPAAASRVMQLDLVGARSAADGTGEGQLPGIVNYLLGNDAAAWKTGIPTYERARFREVYPGIDLVYYGNQSQLEYDFVVAAGARPDQISLRFSGADAVSVEASGELALKIGDRQIRWRVPVAYQEINGIRSPVSAAYRKLSEDHVGFVLGEYDVARPLVIDPLLVYSTYLGGNDLDALTALAVDGWGNTYLAGATYSTNFPVFRAYRTNAYAYADGFVSKLNSNATALVFSTYFGGGSNDWVNAIAVDSSSNVFVAGFTDSLNFPLRNAFQSTAGNFGDAFLTRFGPFGSNLVYSTYYGDSSGSQGFYEEAFGVAVNNSGGAWIAGVTESGSAFNSKAPIQNGFGGGFLDGMVARFDTTQSGNGSLVWGTWLGGNYSELAYAVAVDTNDNCYVTGVMREETDDFGVPLTPTFPIANAFQPNYGGGFNDAFVTKINNSANPSIVFSTYLGGSSEDAGYGVAVDAAGQVHVAGETSSEDFPIVNGHQSSQGDSGFFSDAFVAKFNAAGSGLQYSTYYGGNRADGGRSIQVDRFGSIYLVGYTESPNLSITPDAVDSGLNGVVGVDADLFVAKFNPSVPGPSGLVFGTYFGGSEREANSGFYDFYSLFSPANLGIGLGIDTNLNMYIASDTTSTNLLLTGGVAYRTNSAGAGDAFAAKLTSPVDISVGLTVSTNLITVGSNLVYTLYVNNNGLGNFTNVIVTSTLPPNLQLISVTNAIGTVSNTGSLVTFAFGNLTNNAARIATLVAKTLAPGVVTTRVDLVSSTLDANTNNNSATIASTVRGIANLAIGAVISPNPVFASSNLTVTLSVTNLGPWTATDVVLTNPVPANATFVNATSSQGPTAVAGGLVYAFLQTLPSNAVATVTIAFTAGPLGGAFTDRAGLYGYEVDPVLANNSVASSTSVTPLSDVRIGLSTNSFTGANLFVSSNLTYRVYVTNDGPSTAASAFITNVLPAGVTFVSATSSSGSCTQFQGIVTCNLGSLSSNETATLTVVTRPTVVGWLTNAAVIASSSSDPFPLNNTSVAATFANPIADVALSVVGPAGPVVVTSNLLYSVTLSNRGPTFATNVIFTATLPPNTLFVAAPVSSGTTQLVGNVFTATLPLLNASSSLTIPLTLQPMLEGPITTPLAVNSSVFDPNLSNNTVSVSTTITNHPDGPILRIARTSTNVVLYWTTNSAGYVLYNRPDDLVSSSWRSVTNPPVIRGTQFFVTNSIVRNPLSILASASYYRLQRTTFLPALTVTRVGTNLTLSWPVTFSSWSLQSTPEFVSTNLWITISNNPALVSGRYYLTQGIAGPQLFYRLAPP